MGSYQTDHICRQSNSHKLSSKWLQLGLDCFSLIGSTENFDHISIDQIMTLHIGNGDTTITYDWSIVRRRYIHTNYLARHIPLTRLDAATVWTNIFCPVLLIFQSKNVGTEETNRTTYYANIIQFPESHIIVACYISIFSKWWQIFSMQTWLAKGCFFGGEIFTGEHF